MNRYLDALIRADLARHLVVLTGPRQVGKTTLSRQLLGQDHLDGQYLNYDVPAHRAVLLAGQWRQDASLLVFDEVHKMHDWKAWLKGVWDGRAPGQAVLVTGSARMDTFRKSGESLAGRYRRWRLHPLSVREWMNATGSTAPAALAHLLERGGFPEPALASDAVQAQRWRADYFSGLVREDVMEFSRLQEINAMRLFAELLRSRVGSPLSLASMARDLAVAPSTLRRYLDILEALFIVFTVRPWHRNVARATLQAPKVYFYDTGLVQGDEGIRFENLVACHLLRWVQYSQDAAGRQVDLHYVRTKDEAEVDFAVSESDTLTALIECKRSDERPHRALQRFATEWPDAEPVQLVHHLAVERDVGRIRVRGAANWLAQLEV